LESDTPCPNCHSPVPVGETVCPRCGQILPPGGTSFPVWPPPPTSGPSPLPPSPRLLTKTVWGDVTLGGVIALAAALVGGVGFIAMPILYFVLRPTVPMFARGIGYGFLASLVLLLGAFALCIFGFGHEPT
jgi:hypothetical protein